MKETLSYFVGAVSVTSFIVMKMLLGRPQYFVYFATSSFVESLPEQNIRSARHYRGIMPMLVEDDEDEICAILRLQILNLSISESISAISLIICSNYNASMRPVD